MAPDSRSLLDCIVAAGKDGYKEIFRVDNYVLVSPDGKQNYDPGSVVIENFYHVDASSGRSTIFLIQTSDHRKGVVIDTAPMKPEQRFINFISAPGDHPNK